MPPLNLANEVIGNFIDVGVCPRSLWPDDLFEHPQHASGSEFAERVLRHSESVFKRVVVNEPRKPLPFGRLHLGNIELFQRWRYGGSARVPPFGRAVLARATLTPRAGVLLHVHEQLTGTTFRQEADGRRTILQVVVSGLPGINADGFRPVANILSFVYTRGGGKGFTCGLVTNELDSHSPNFQT